MTLADRLRENSREPSWKLRPEILCEGRIPQPLHGMAPREVLGQAWWDKTRRAAYASTEYHCIACGVHKTVARYRKTLDGHELYDIDYLAGRMVYVETVPLCTACHSYVHQGRLKWLLDTHRISAERYIGIIQHGDAVLSKHRLSRCDYDGPFAAWADWRLVIDDKEYPPLFKCLDDQLRSRGA